MKQRYLIIVFLMLALPACGHGPNILPTNAATLPDLVVSDVYLGMQGVASNRNDCIPSYGPFEIRAVIRNLGEVPAYNISVNELSTATNLTVGELNAGQGMELIFPTQSASAGYKIVIDPQNNIPERNEDNNTYSYLVITPTPPAMCTPTPVP